MLIWKSQLEPVRKVIVLNCPSHSIPSVANPALGLITFHGPLKYLLWFSLPTYSRVKATHKWMPDKCSETHPWSRQFPTQKQYITSHQREIRNWTVKVLRNQMTWSFLNLESTYRGLCLWKWNWFALIPICKSSLSLPVKGVMATSVLYTLQYYKWC